MSERTLSYWERASQAHAIDGELYLAGMRAGAVAARSDWPHVERVPQYLQGRCQREMKPLFGAASPAAGVLEYRAGWIEGYARCCAQLDQQPSSNGPR